MKKLLLGLTLLSSLTAIAHEEVTDLDVVKSTCNKVYSETSGGVPAYKCFNTGTASLLNHKSIDQVVFDMCTKVYSETSGGVPAYKCFDIGTSFLQGHHYKMIKRTCNRIYSNTSGGVPAYKCFRDSFNDMLENY